MVDLLALGERRAMAGHHDVELERLQAVERRRPLLDEAVAHVRQAVAAGTADEEVAGEHDALLGEEHEGVATGVAAPRKMQLHLAAALHQGHGVAVGQVRRGRHRLL
ncbi:MAG: hypothetical protein J4F37_14690, partial [Acidobacteria bacterium]|nr:hypothetical protein [Acidobacteriota bacterium]